MRNILYTRMLSCLNVWSFVAFVPLENLSLIWKCQHYRWRAAKCRPLLSTYGFSARRDLDRATLAATRELNVCCPVLRTVSFNRLFYLKQWVLRTYMYFHPVSPPFRDGGDTSCGGFFLLKNVIYFCSGITLITKNTILIK